MGRGYLGQGHRPSSGLIHACDLDDGSGDRGDPVGGEGSENTRQVHDPLAQRKFPVYVENQGG